MLEFITILKETAEFQLIQLTNSCYCISLKKQCYIRLITKIIFN